MLSRIPARMRSARGITLLDMLVTITVLAIVSSIAIPVFGDMTENMRLGQAAREVERELQTARLRAVSANRPIRVRFNCPVVGEYRMVELIGTPGAPHANDAAMNRCQESTYPFPAPDNNPLTTPNHDGPQRRLHPSVSFGAIKTLEFWPDGSVHADAGSGNPWPVLPVAGTAITLTKGVKVKSITVNGLGKIQVQ